MQQSKLFIVSVSLFVHNLVMGQNSKNTPNIILIIADQWRGSAIGFKSKELVKTPFLDSLSHYSLSIDQMVSNYPLCSPARAMLLSGNYPLKNHVYTNVNSNSSPDSVELPTNIVCWSDILKKNGYYNGYIGKWHLDSPHNPYVNTYNNEGKVAWNEWTPPSRRHSFDYWYSYGTYDKHQKPMYWDTNDHRDSFHYVNEWSPKHETEKALTFLEGKKGIRPKNKPFSLVISYNPPHSEYQEVPKQYYEQYSSIPDSMLLQDPDIPESHTPMGKEYRNNIKYYYADITGIDDQISRVFSGLKKFHLDTNTIVIIMSDHGNCLGKHNEISKNNYFEESLSIPFLIYWKGHIVPRRDNVFLGSIPDIYPTILDMVGLKNQVPNTIDGISYASYFLNKNMKKPENQFIIGGIPSNSTKINSGFRGVRTNRYKLVYTRRGSLLTSALFDLKNDPYELTNIYTTANKQIIAELQSQLITWLRKTKDPFTLK